MASNIKYPEDNAKWFIQGDKFCLITNLDDDGDNSPTGAPAGGFN